MPVALLRRCSTAISVHAGALFLRGGKEVAHACRSVYGSACSTEFLEHVACRRQRHNRVFTTAVFCLYGGRRVHVLYRVSVGSEQKTQHQQDSNAILGDMFERCGDNSSPFFPIHAPTCPAVVVVSC